MITNNKRCEGFKTSHLFYSHKYKKTIYYEHIKRNSTLYLATSSKSIGINNDAFYDILLRSF